MHLMAPCSECYLFCSLFHHSKVRRYKSLLSYMGLFRNTIHSSSINTLSWTRVMILKHHIIEYSCVLWGVASIRSPEEADKWLSDADVITAWLCCLTYTFLPMYRMTFLIVCLDYIILIQLMRWSTVDLLSTNIPLRDRQVFDKALQIHLSLVMNIYYKWLFDGVTEQFIFSLPKNSYNIHNACHSVYDNWFGIG